MHMAVLLGVHSLVWDEARKLAGKDPVRHCPICDGFEVIDADVAVIG
jgi:hypothetical protein